MIGYGVGLPLAGASIWDALAHDFDLARQLKIGVHFNEIGSIFVTLGHVGLVILLCRFVRWATVPMSCAGRMALTNYLCQSIICATIFYGCGFGMFGQVSRFELWGIIIAIWAVQLTVSTIWLHYFQHGPAEWLWRTLTYWKRPSATTAPPVCGPGTRER